MNVNDAIARLTYIAREDDSHITTADIVALEMAIKALQEQIVWHPYPKEMPNEVDRWYIVTYTNRVGFGYFTDELEWATEGITAWAELPKPYEEGAEDEDSD